MSLEKITRREALALIGLALVSGCRDKDDDFVPVPGISPSEASHTMKGNVKDLEQNPIPNALVNLQVINNNVNYSNNTNSNGSYLINNIQNNIYQLSVVNSGFFNYVDDSFRINISSDTINKDFVLIPRKQLAGTDYRDLIEMLKDITGNRDGRSGTRPDSVQRVRRFDIANKIKVYLNRNSVLGQSGYSLSAKSALDDWESELGKNIFEEINNQRDSNIEFSYGGLGQKGLTQVIEYETKNSVSIIKKAKISIDDNLSLQDVKKSALREIGFTLFGAERYSKDDIHSLFKDSSNPDLIRSSGITPDEVNMFNIYYGLPIGEDLNPYRSS